jgi:glutamate-1-semialdehyde 2,1-aminomutase
VLLKRYISKTSRSRKLYDRAKKFLPAGVSYFIRHFEPYPFYTKEARGSKIVDIDGNEYIDFWMGHYTLILGHSPPEVVKAVRDQIDKGFHYGTSHELEVAMAEQIVKMVPSAKMVRFTNSGTEAAMYATRLARTYTDREKIVKVEGCWHGGYDSLHKAIKPPFDIPETSGITSGVSKDTLTIPFNNLEEARKKLKKEEFAAVIVEPVLGSGGGLPADKDFLKGLKEICTEKNALLMFDEVITGFRLAPGGAQQYFGILPDITILGKIMGGGFPVGAITGSREIMEHMDPTLYERPKFSFHGGTFCANPVVMAAGLTTLKELEDGKLQNQLNRSGDKVRQQLTEVFGRKNVDVQVIGISSLFQTHFTHEKLKDVEGVFRADREKLEDYHLYLITKGVFFLPTKLGALSRAHSKEDFEKLIAETENYMRENKGPGWP